MLIPQGGLLALDWGLKKVGLATLDETGTVITPRSVFLRRQAGQTWSLNQDDKIFLQQALSDYEPGALVLGLPLLPGGGESESSGHARRFAVKLQSFTGLAVHLVSETLSSWEHRGQAQEDSKAAATLLADYMQSRGA